VVWALPPAAAPAGNAQEPLADPYILGIFRGAPSAVAAIVTGLSAISIYSLPAAAFLGALACFMRSILPLPSKIFPCVIDTHRRDIPAYLLGPWCFFLIAVVNPNKMHSSLIWLYRELSCTETP